MRKDINELYDKLAQFEFQGLAIQAKGVLTRVDSVLDYHGIAYSEVMILDDEFGNISIEWIYDTDNMRAGVNIEHDENDSGWWFVALGNASLGNMQLSGSLHKVNVDIIISGFARLLLETIGKTRQSDKEKYFG
jgi:hypothetical protein